MADQRIWRIRIRRIGETSHQVVEIQRHRREPKLGEVIDVAIGLKSVRAKIAHIHAPPLGMAGTFVVDADEVDPQFG